MGEYIREKPSKDNSRAVRAFAALDDEFDVWRGAEGEKRIFECRPVHPCEVFGGEGRSKPETSSRDM